jgi:hypothetical protein
MMFSPEYFVFLFSVLKHKIRSIWDKHFASVVCGCEIFSLMFRKKSRLRVLWNRMLGTVLGFKRE